MYQRIRDLREDRDLSQEDIAFYLNIITGGVDFYGLKEAGEVSYEIGGWISNSTNQSYSATIIQPYYL